MLPVCILVLLSLDIVAEAKPSIGHLDDDAIANKFEQCDVLCKDESNFCSAEKLKCTFGIRMKMFEDCKGFGSVCDEASEGKEKCAQTFLECLGSPLQKPFTAFGDDDDDDKEFEQDGDNFDDGGFGPSMLFDMIQ